MAKTSLPSPEILRQLLRYEPDTGKLYWRERPRELFSSEQSPRKWNTRYAGTEAFTTEANGYKEGRIFRRLVKAHRAAWAVSYGCWPPEHIDHINGDRSDNRLENLRLATPAENSKNQKKPSTNTSGVVGVYWNKHNGNWRARIKSAQRNIEVGSFDCIAAAILARHIAERKYGFHPNHGR